MITVNKMTTYSGIEEDLVGLEQQEDLVLSSESGLENALIIIPSIIDTTGQNFLISPPLAVSVLVSNPVTVVVPTTTEADLHGENQGHETMLESPICGFENSFDPVFGITDVQFDVQDEVKVGMEMDDLESSMTTQTAGSSKGKVSSQTTHNSTVGVKDLKIKSTDEFVLDLLSMPPSSLQPHVAQDMQNENNAAEARRKNAEAARKYRANKRFLDGKRDTLIKIQDVRIKELERQVQKWTNDLQVYQNKNSEG